MTRADIEEIFIAAIMQKKDCLLIEMTLEEAKVMRVLIGRITKEMERKNRAMWMAAREYGVEYTKPFAVLRRANQNRYKVMVMEADGTMTPFATDAYKGGVTSEDDRTGTGQDNRQGSGVRIENQFLDSRSGKDSGQSSTEEVV
jgi:hypothetical protein